MEQQTGRRHLHRDMAENIFSAGNVVTLEVAGRTALFADPTTSCGGEKVTMEIPSYSALIGFMSSIFWKPAIVWHIDKVRVMNPIIAAAEGKRLPGLDGSIDLANYK